MKIMYQAGKVYPCELSEEELKRFEHGCIPGKSPPPAPPEQYS